MTPSRPSLLCVRHGPAIKSLLTSARQVSEMLRSTVVLTRPLAPINPSNTGLPTALAALFEWTLLLKPVIERASSSAATILQRMLQPHQEQDNPAVYENLSPSTLRADITSWAERWHLRVSSDDRFIIDVHQRIAELLCSFLGREPSLLVNSSLMLLRALFPDADQAVSLRFLSCPTPISYVSLHL